MPREGTALDSGRKVTQTGECGELAQLLCRRIVNTGHKIMELRKQRLYFSSRLAFDAFRHQGCRGFRNGAPFSLKTGIGDDVAIYPQVHSHSVATKRSVA